MTVTSEKLVTLAAVTCGACGITFGMPERYVRERRNDHGTFYCPNGHAHAYNGPTEAETLRKQLASEKQLKEWADSRAQSYKDQADTAEARRRAQKAANTKLKKRIANGVCPCCHRNFQDLRRHMDGQHPDYATTETS